MSTDKIIGYIRVSTADQNTARQLDGIKLDKVFIDKISGKNTDRPELKNMLDFVREGDTIVVHSMDRLARNLLDLRAMVQDLTQRKIKIQFIHEKLTFTGDDSPMSILLLSLLGAVAEFGRSLIRQNQQEGIDIAKAQGKFKGRQPKIVDDEKIVEIKRLFAASENKCQLARDLKISKSTLYRYVNMDV